MNVTLRKYLILQIIGIDCRNCGKGVFIASLFAVIADKEVIRKRDSDVLRSNNFRFLTYFIPLGEFVIG